MALQETSIVEASRQAPSLAATVTPPDDHLGGSSRRHRQKKPPASTLMHVLRPTD